MPKSDLGRYIYVNPDFEPYNDDTIFDGTWIHLKSIEVKFRTAMHGDNEGGLVFGKDGPEFYFLAPSQIMETVNHAWDPWETMSSRIAGRGIDFVQVVKDWGSIKESLGNIGKDFSVGSFFKRLSSATEKVNYKVDTPLVYADTDRLEWNLEFNLSSSDKISQTTMLVTLNVLRSLSMPMRNDSATGLSIDLPYIFDLTVERQNGDKCLWFSQPTNVYCAITSFQPTFLEPYVEGNPMRVNLTLTLKELSPRYAIQRFSSDETVDYNNYEKV